MSRLTSVDRLARRLDDVFGPSDWYLCRADGPINDKSRGYVLGAWWEDDEDGGDWQIKIEGSTMRETMLRALVKAR